MDGSPSEILAEIHASLGDLPERLAAVLAVGADSSPLPGTPLPTPDSPSLPLPQTPGTSGPPSRLESLLDRLGTFLEGFRNSPLSGPGSGVSFPQGGTVQCPPLPAGANLPPWQGPPLPQVVTLPPGDGPPLPLSETNRVGIGMPTEAVINNPSPLPALTGPPLPEAARLPEMASPPLPQVGTFPPGQPAQPAAANPSPLPAAGQGAPAPSFPQLQALALPSSGFPQVATPLPPPAASFPSVPPLGLPAGAAFPEVSAPIPPAASFPLAPPAQQGPALPGGAVPLPAGQGGMGGGEVVDLLRQILQALQQSGGAGPGSSGPMPERKMVAGSSADAGSLEDHEGHPAASPSVNVSSLDGLRGASSFRGFGSRAGKWPTGRVLEGGEK